MTENIEDTLAKIVGIIRSGDLQNFIGIREDEFFDAKSELYKLEDEKGRIELAKDVSSFANSGGGYIVLGLKTKDLEDIRAEEVNELNLILADDFKAEQYGCIIEQYVYPKIAGLTVDYIADKKNSDRGLAYICIPPQNDSRKFFLMIKLSDDKTLPKIMFGIAQRNGTSSEPLDYKQLYKKMQNGVSTTAQHLTSIKESLSVVMGQLEHLGSLQTRQTDFEDLKIENGADTMNRRIQEIKEDKTNG